MNLEKHKDYFNPLDVKEQIHIIGKVLRAMPLQLKEFA